MFFFKPAQASLTEAFVEERNPARLAHLGVVQQMLDGREAVVAGTKPINRYSIQEGKIFGSSSKAKTKYKVLRVIADDVVIMDLQTKKIQTYHIDFLLKDWSDRGFREVSILEDIIDTVKSLLGPSLGVFLTAALIAWLTEKLR